MNNQLNTPLTPEHQQVLQAMCMAFMQSVMATMQMPAVVQPVATTPTVGANPERTASPVNAGAMPDDYPATKEEIEQEYKDLTEEDLAWGKEHKAVDSVLDKYEGKRVAKIPMPEKRDGVAKREVVLEVRVPDAHALAVRQNNVNIEQFVIPHYMAEVAVRGFVKKYMLDGEDIHPALVEMEHDRKYKRYIYRFVVANPIELLKMVNHLPKRVVKRMPWGYRVTPDDEWVMSYINFYQRTKKESTGYFQGSWCPCHMIYDERYSNMPEVMQMASKNMEESAYV